MATRKPAPVDQRSIDLAKIDAEIVRLGKQIADKQAVLLADTSKHALDQSPDLQRRLGTEISTIASLIEQLRDKRFKIKIEIGEASEIVAPAPKAAPVPRRAWVIKNLPEPTYPAGARQAGDDKALAIGLTSFVEYYIDQAKIAMQKAGVDAAGKASIELLMDVAGEHIGAHHWMSERLAELEARVAEVEGYGIKFGGVYQRASSYQRGTVVTFKGSAWIALKYADAGCAPEDSPDLWQLMIKRGQDGKDARP